MVFLWNVGCVLFPWSMEGRSLGGKIRFLTTCVLSVDRGRSILQWARVGEKCRLRCEVRNRVRSCVAKTERLKIRKRNRMFITCRTCRFKTPRMKSRCDRMMVDGGIASSLKTTSQLQFWWQMQLSK